MDDLPQRDLLTAAAVGNCRRALAVLWELSLQRQLKSVSRTRSTPLVRSVRKLPMTWSPVTESNRRPSPYHGRSLCLGGSRWVASVQFWPVTLSGSR